jgi:hypothetical protein
MSNGGGLATAATGAATAFALGSNPAGWAILGVGALTAGFGALASDKEAGARYNLLGEQISDVKGAMKGANKMYDEKLGIAQDLFSQDTTNLGKTTGNTLFDINQQGSQLSSQAGFASSGIVDTTITRMQDRTMDEYGMRKQDLTDILGSKMMGLAEKREDDIGRLKTEQKKLEYERELADADRGWGGNIKNFLFG